jgi:tetratricopeptide (TPR) repeat protein
MKRIVSMILLLIGGAILTQGFQCASAEMSTAKVKYQKKLYDAAEDAVNKELTKNPANDEAKVLLLQILEKQKKEQELINAIKKYEGDLVDPHWKEEFQLHAKELWINKYQEAGDAYAKYLKKVEQAKSRNRDVKKVPTKEVEQAIEDMKVVIAVRPEMAMPYEDMGNYYWAMEEYEKAEESYNKYLRIVEKDLNFAKENGFNLYSTRGEVIKALGEPAKTDGKSDARPTVDSTYNDHFVFGGKNVYTTSIKMKDGEPEVYGWRVNPPKYWMEFENYIINNISDNAIRSLAQYYYDKKDFNSALKYAKKIVEITPDADDVRPFLIELYQKTNQTDLLVKEVNKHVQENPNSGEAYAYLGDVYRLTEEFDKSIEAYKKAIELDNSIVNAKLNLAVAYQNKAAKISNEEANKLKADENYQINTAAFEPLLNDAVELYKQVINDKEYATNYEVYVEIINIMYVLNKPAEMEKYVVMVEGLEGKIKDASKKDYYGKLYNLFGKIQDSERAKKFEQKYLN